MLVPGPKSGHLALQNRSGTLVMFAVSSFDHMGKRKSEIFTGPQTSDYKIWMFHVITQCIDSICSTLCTNLLLVSFIWSMKCITAGVQMAALAVNTCETVVRGVLIAGCHTVWAAERYLFACNTFCESVAVKLNASPFVFHMWAHRACYVITPHNSHLNDTLCFNPAEPQTTHIKKFNNPNWKKTEVLTDLFVVQSNGDTAACFQLYSVLHFSQLCTYTNKINQSFLISSVSTLFSLDISYICSDNYRFSDSICILACLLSYYCHFRSVNLMCHLLIFNESFKLPFLNYKNKTSAMMISNTLIVPVILAVTCLATS